MPVSIGWLTYSRTWAQRIRVGREDPGVRYLGDLWAGAEHGWGFDWLYQRAIIRPYREAGAFLSNVFDQQGIDGVLVEGPGRLVRALSEELRHLQSGYIRNYALVFLFGVIIVLGYFVWR